MKSNDPLYKEMLGYRKINHFNVVTSTVPVSLAAAADFSRSSIESRIDAGYDDAVAQGIGDIDAPLLLIRRHRALMPHAR